MAGYARALGMELLAYGLCVSEAGVRAHGAEPAPLDTSCRRRTRLVTISRAVPSRRIPAISPVSAPPPDASASTAAAGAMPWVCGNLIFAWNFLTSSPLLSSRVARQGPSATSSVTGISTGSDWCGARLVPSCTWYGPALRLPDTDASFRVPDKSRARPPVLMIWARTMARPPGPR
ncbi:hypothetical protein OG763_02780 [Streptomyces sp. NBC_01230]|uniref:hypothetical protein n=1 Tax=Streptomyces sp. NBC_01230 TaxID=2903784 RepID=UPI002E0F13FD|nr:hypothetical protein OG763_02780 [Streptomyces sp. NBC_01230]